MAARVARFAQCRSGSLRCPPLRLRPIPGNDELLITTCPRNMGNYRAELGA